MLKILYKNIHSKKIDKIKKIKPGSWLFCYDLNPSDVQFLIELGFDKNLIEDALDYFEVPRFEQVQKINYFYTRYPVNTKDGELSTAPLLIAFNDKILLTISHQKPEILDNFAHSRHEIITTQKVKTFLVFLDQIIQSYNTSLIKIRKILIKFLGNIENVSEQNLKELISLESTLVDYHSALKPMQNFLDRLVKNNKKEINFHHDDLEILEDLYQDTYQILDTVENTLKTAKNIRSTHEVILSHQLNNSMKRLTALTIILTIPALIAGIFGMNTWLPVPTNILGFFLVILFITLNVIVVIIWFKKNNWL